MLNLFYFAVLNPQLKCMNLKTFTLLILLLSYQLSNAQSERFHEFGKPTQEELELKTYAPEPNATGVILYETGNYYAASIVRRTAVRLVMEIHRKVKVLDAKKFDYATVEIPYYEGNGYYGEEILDYKAVTHNGSIKNYIPEDAFYKTQKSRAVKELTFTFPNVQDGSILEYKYTIASPYFYNLDGWQFQHDLPTISSIFQTVLPSNFNYHKVLYGTNKLKIQNSTIKKNGFLLPNNSGKIDTEVCIYAMENIPSFIEEKYMLSKKNYISRIVYEPLYFKAFTGSDHIFTRSWDDVDDRFKIRKDFGEQLSKKNYFKRKLPDSILDTKDDLKRAKGVYNFIQNAYTWNGSYFIYGNNIKDAFDEKLGSVSTINISLVNALNAANLEANTVILSTRNNGLATELYPVLSNYNYVLAVLKINNETYLLDATNKQAPFGVIPFQALNVQGRVMDFKKGSYWMPLEPYKKNIHYVNAQLNASEDGNFTGTVNQASYGYIGLEKRSTIEAENLQAYIQEEEKDKAGIEIEDYTLEDLDKIEKPLKENYKLSLAPEIVGDKVVLYPFFNKTYITENPFKMETRSYPMDFGFPFTNTYLIAIDLGEVYKVEQLPESRSVKLPNDDGECSVTYLADGNKINIRFNMKLNAYRYPTDAYPSLKKFFGSMIRMLKEESIILEKI